MKKLPTPKQEFQVKNNIINYNEQEEEVKELTMKELEEEFIRECVMTDNDWDEHNELCLEHVGYWYVL